MAPCTTAEDCDAAFRLICKSGHCVCRPGDLFFDWPKYGCFSKVRMFGTCEVSGQCVAMNPNTYCNPDNLRCTCSPNYFYNGRECTLRYDGSNLKAQEVYKAAVVAAACFIVAVVGIFVACIVRRSFCRREQNLPQSESNRNSDIFSISDEIAALRAVDKPPSYEEVLQIERTFYGIPPPEYSASRIVNTSRYHLPSSFASDQVNYLGLPYPSECIARASSLETRNSDASNIEHCKDSNVCDTNNLRPTASSSNFLAAAEVLDQPSNTEDTPNTSPSTDRNSQDMPRYISSTPPLCLRRQHVRNTAKTSSSLPGSPVLSSHSSCIGLSLPFAWREESLKSNCQMHESSSCGVPASQVDIPSNSTPRERNTSGSEPSTLAYDNLGFVSDFHV